MEECGNHAFNVKTPLFGKSESVYAAQCAIGSIMQQSLNGNDYVAIRGLSQYGEKGFCFAHDSKFCAIPGVREDRGDGIDIQAGRPLSGETEVVGTS
jgi:hypothetical protein